MNIETLPTYHWSHGTEYANQWSTMSPVTRKRIRIEGTIVRRLIRELRKAGYALSGNDGEDIFDYTTERQFMRDLFAADEAVIYTEKDGHRAHVYLVYGNDGVDVISDHSTSLGPIIGPIYDWIDKRFDN